MEENENLKPKSPRETEKERLDRFPDVPVFHRPDLVTGATGVLLADQIEYYCKNYQLLFPYAKANIKAANYELRIGYKYTTGGRKYELKEGDFLTIKKFDVAVIEILETVNMPPFLIGRWNIRTKWAYEGLIWVGGPQVDAGYRGRIMCPLWNLSNRDFRVKCGESGESIAVIDFVFTTPPTKLSKGFEYDWRERHRFVFEDYVYDDEGNIKLQSGLVEETAKAIEQLTQEAKKSQASREWAAHAIEQARSRIDGVTSVMFTALGVLIAAIAVFATKPPQDAAKYWWEPTVLFLCWATTVLSLLAWVRSGTESRWWKGTRALIGVIAIAAGCLIIRLEGRVIGEFKTNANDLQLKIEQLQKNNQSLQVEIEATQRELKEYQKHHTK